MLISRNRLKNFIFLLSLFSFLFLSTATFASVFNVTNEIELRDALSTAAMNEEDDTINIAAGTYNTSGTTFTYTPAAGENNALTIVGAGAEATMLDGGNSDQVLRIETFGLADDSNAHIIINNLTIQNGNNNTTNDGGGLVILTNSANVSIHNCEFFNSFVVANPEFGNGSSGGAMFLVTGGGGSVSIENCEFDNNSAVAVGIEIGLGIGGAVSISGSDVTLSNSIFNNNSAEGEEGALGGALNVQIGGDLILTNNTFSENSANVASEILGSGAVGGGANLVADGDIMLTDNTFDNNSSNSGAPFGGGLGGGVSVGSSVGNIALTNNIFLNNSANSKGTNQTSGGGANVSNFISGDITLVNNIFVNNFAATLGGGANVSTPSGIVTLTNNTITENSADTDSGGGLRVGLGFFGEGADTTANIYNNIVFNNTAALDGDDIFISDDGDSNNLGSPVNLFNNDFSDFFSACENTIGCIPNISEGNNIDEDPLFVDAASGDVHLTKGSPTIDTGDPNAPALPATDFEGDPRDIDGDGDGTTPDIGVDEFVPGVGDGGGDGCSIAQSVAQTPIPLYLLILLFVLMRRLWRRYIR